jgi:hypothetical protein
MGKFFSRITAAGTLGATIITYLTAGWGVLISAALAIVVWAWASLSAWIAAPAVQSAGYVFLFSLWTYIGLSTIIGARKPRLTSTVPDYRYGLTFEGIFPNFLPTNEPAALQFGLQFRNFSSGPLQYHVEYFDFRIGSRSSPKVKRGELTSYLPRGAGRTSSAVPFSKKDIVEFFGTSVSGTLDFAVTYGPPDDNYVLDYLLNISRFGSNQ